MKGSKRKSLDEDTTTNPAEDPGRCYSDDTLGFVDGPSRMMSTKNAGQSTAVNLQTVVQLVNESKLLKIRDVMSEFV